MGPTATGQPRPRFKLLTVEDLASMPPPEWLIPGVLVAGSFCVLYGQPGAGKSFLALDLALEIARYGPVVYNAAEGQGGLYNRVQAAQQERQITTKNVYFLAVPVDLRDPNTVDDLIEAIRVLAEPKLVVVDTMARSMVGGDENSAKDVGEFIAGIDRLRSEFGCAVLLVHHAKKADARVERGSSALRGAADTMMYLDERGKTDLLLSCEKQKDAAPFPDLHLSLGIVALPTGETSCVIRRDSTFNDAPTVLAAHERAIQTILAAASGGLRHSDIKTRFVAEAHGSGSAFDRAWRTLKGLGLIEMGKDKRYLLVGQCQVSKQCQDGVSTPELVS
jgi:hypothetical protein